jgi:bacterial/archaeal transporter family protein
MKTWMWQAVISMLFAGFTSVIAKLGLTGISGDLGLAVRTAFVFIFVLIFAAAVVPAAQFSALTRSNIGWLALSGVTTAVSWVFYYRAIKSGEVSTVALIDKGSVVVALVLAWLVLGETMNMTKLLGAGLIVSGILVLTRA